MPIIDRLDLTNPTIPIPADELAVLSTKRPTVARANISSKSGTGG